MLSLNAIEATLVFQLQRRQARTGAGPA